MMPSRRSTLLGVATALVVALPCMAQLPPDPDYVRTPVFATFEAFQDELDAIVATADVAARTARLDSLWTTLRTAGQVPFAIDDRFALLYRGSASTVGWAGDFNGWNPSATPGTQLAGTDLWMRTGTLPDDARVDYKIVRNGSQWLLDPANPLQMYSGFGPNSELRMPEYEYAQETVRRPGVPRGSITNNVRSTSAALGYDVMHRVYTPAGYDPVTSANLPVVYVTDGHEYLADHMGSLAAVLDNLIDDRSLRPTIAVFIDPRNPDNLGENRRASQYISNPSFVSFVADELVPAIDAAYATATDATDRMILGTSLGGLNSAYFGATRPEVFGKLGIQSPAFWADSSIYNTYDQPATGALQIAMTAGTINDGTGGPTMEPILDSNGYDYTYTESNEGHSWGNWRARLPEMLRTLIGSPDPIAGDFNGDGTVDGADYSVWRDGLDTAAYSEAAYTTWRANYGATLATSASVAEPGASLLAIGAVVWVSIGARR